MVLRTRKRPPLQAQGHTTNHGIMDAVGARTNALESHRASDRGRSERPWRLWEARRSYGRGIQRRKLPLHGGLCYRQTPGTGGFNNLHRVANGVVDMRWAAGEPFLQGTDEQSLMDTTKRTSHDTCEHTRPPL